MSSPTVSAKGETRNQPRKRKESNDDQPLFLKKAFVMISTCPPGIACWAEDGKSFIVKDSERLAAEIIPTVYKHNKFSSFVRQLNLYGFRKVRSDSLSNTSDWWVFKHPQFRRDDENAISKIKKSSHFVEPPPNCKDEATEMKNQMANLNSRIVELDNVVAYLINTLQQQTVAQQQQQVQASMVPMQVNSNNTNAFIQQQSQPDSPLSTSSAVPAVLSQYQQQQVYQLQNVVDHNSDNNNNNTTHDKKRKIKATAGGGGESPRIYNSSNNNNSNNMDQQGQQQSVFGNNYTSNNNVYNGTRGFVPLSPISSTIQPQQQVSQFVSNNIYMNGYANNTFIPSNYAVSQPELYRHNNTTSASATTGNNNAYYGDEEDEEEEIDDDFDFGGLFDATADDDEGVVSVADVYDYDNINKKTLPVAVLHSASNNSISNNSMSIDIDHHHVMSLSPAAVAVNSSSGKTTLVVTGIDNNNSPQSVTMISSIDTDNTSHLSGHSASASTKTSQLYSASAVENNNSKHVNAGINNNISTKEGIVAGTDTTTATANTTSPLNITNISEIMQVLPKHLQERFIDQLALSIGQNVLSMPMSGGGFDENIIAGRCSSEVLSNVTAELDWQVKNASADKCPKTQQQLEASHYLKQQLQNDYSGEINTDNNKMITNDNNNDEKAPAAVMPGGMIPTNSAVISNKTMTVGQQEMTSMGVTTLEEHCPLVALGALLASVRLSTSGATESAIQVFSKSCSNFKEKINKLSNHPAVMNASATTTTSLSTKMLPMGTLSIPRLMKTNSSSRNKDLMTTTGSNSSSGKSDGEQLSSLAVGPEEDISIYSI